MVPTIEIIKSELMKRLIWTALSAASFFLYGCVSTPTGGVRLGESCAFNDCDQKGALERKDLVLNFPAWTSDTDKQSALREFANGLVYRKCGSARYELVNVRSIGYQGSLTHPTIINSISADVKCIVEPIAASVPESRADQSSTSSAAVPSILVASDAKVVPSDFIANAKAQCKDLGFKEKTEKFGECVLELSRRGAATKPTINESSVRGDGGADDQACAGYGYRVGTAAYSDCRLQLDMARRDYEREMRAYEAEKAAYERRVAEAQAEQRRQQQQRQAQYGFCIAQCSSQPGATTLGCMSRCGAASAGLSYDPGAPPARPSGRTTYVINGQIINCRTSPSGSVVTCN
jgi:hypothetical protein